MSEKLLKVFVEVPKGSRNKYEYNPQTGDIEFDRRLFAAVSFPADYGFIPGTAMENGDPVDALVCVDDPTFPGCTIAVKAIALFKMSDENGPDHKVVCVPLKDPAWSSVDEVEALPGSIQDEIAHFFDVYTMLEDQDVSIEGWGPSQEALDLVERARRRYAGGSDRGTR